MWIKGMLKATAQHYALITSNNLFSSVAMVNIEVNNGNPFQLIGLKGITSSNNNVIKDAKTHSAVVGGMVPGWSGEETEIQIQEKENIIALNPIKQKSGKIVHAWAYEDKNNIDPQLLKSNSASLEYPPKSGKIITFPEMDRYEFFNYDDALLKINVAQQSFIKELRQQLILKQLIDAQNL